MNNEYLQEKVMGECVHSSDWCTMRKTYVCHKCDKEKWDGATLTNRDFSTPKDYCALEDKMTELGEWESLFIYIYATKDGCWDPKDAPLYFLSRDRTQRAALIAEYWRQK